MDRRKFLKTSGAAGAVAGGVGLGFFGYEAGRDPDSYTGWKNREGGFQTFNRIKWAVEKPTYEKTGPSRRVDARSEVVFSRLGPLFRNWKEEEGTNSLPEYLKNFYNANPEVLELDNGHARLARETLDQVGLAGAHRSAQQIPHGHRLEIVLLPQRDVLPEAGLDGHD